MAPIAGNRRCFSRSNRTGHSVWLDTSRQKSRPWGLDGGRAGEGARAVLSEGAQPINHGYTVLQTGDRVAIETAGAGGYGAPELRPVDEVARDLAEGKISEAFAREVYPEQFSQITSSNS